MGSYDAFSDRNMLEKIVKEVKKGECTTVAAFSVSVALVGLSLFIESLPLQAVSPWEFLLLVLIGAGFAIYALKERGKIDRA